jgi:hypothetical protein
MKKRDEDHDHDVLAIDCCGRRSRGEQKQWHPDLVVNNSTSIMGRPNLPTPTYFAFWSTSPKYYPILSHSWLCSIFLLLSATGGVPLIQSIIQPIISVIAVFLLRVAFIVTAISSFLHQTGALRRYAIKFVEDEISKNLNGAMVTFSDGQVDLWRGKVIAHDLIIHNKERDDWEWDSPCLARVGRIEATLNFASVINLPFIGRVLNHTFFDVYTVLVEDIQVFVEKRKNIFNFHLLDPSLDIPNHSIIMEEHKKAKKRNSEQLLATKDEVASEEKKEERLSFVNVVEDVLDRKREEEASKIVEKLVGAVSQIGKAANMGGSKGLQSALKNQKDGFVQNLKHLHSQKLVRGVATEKTDWQLTKEQGVSVMKELGKVVEKNISDMKTSISFLQKPPEKKQGWEAKPPDDIRIGSILVREGRIFTKDILVSAGAHDENLNAASDSDQSRSSPKRGMLDKSSSGWARPIAIFELAVTSAELCPPMSARDPSSGMPVVGISMDRLLDILMKRVTAEVAKSETGRLFQTAFGDVFSFIGDNSTRKE